MNQQSHNIYLHNSRVEMLRYVPKSAQRVLDVGCNSGAFGEALKSERAVEIWGVEPMVDAASDAERVLDKVIVSPFEVGADIPADYFDVVVFNDVLEHLVDPWSALLLAQKKLRQGGVIVASLPNLLHQANLLHLLLKRDFCYEERGIRDRTHLRFFTRKSAVRMFNDTGFEVVKVEGINEDWWTPSLTRRLTFLLFERWLGETKYVQYAFLAKPSEIQRKD